MRHVQKSLKDKRGQATVEYTIVLALLVLVVIGATMWLGGRTADTVEEAGDGFEALEGESIHGPCLQVAAVYMRVRTWGHMVACTVRITDQEGNRVRRAHVGVSWYVNGALVMDDSRQANWRGNARFSYGTPDLASGDVVRLVVTDVAKDEYQYDSDGNVVSAGEIVIP